jgi:uncharacterized heparinase superfamily protein
MYLSASRYWHTLRNLKPGQIANRLWRTIYRPRPTVIGPFAVRDYGLAWVEPIYLDSFMQGPDDFEFLNVRHRVRDARDWNQIAWPLLWRYHLHYFDDLNAVGFSERREWHRALIERWIKEVPVFEGAGWDPYPTSIRIVNWIKWWLGGGPPSDKALRSVRVQLSRVASRLEYHLLGNHLLENAKALTFGGLFFDDQTANQWLRRGLKILAEQLPEQILKDGGHFERSPMYHQITLATVLDLYNLMRFYGRPEQAELLPYIERMLRWSELMSHPDGEIALFNDAALHEGPTPRSLRLYAARMGIVDPAPRAKEATAGAVHLEWSGYVRVARGPYVALLNVGSVAPRYQPGHAHADTLSFELSAMGRRLIVDTGISTYERGERRDWERGSAAHNAIVVNGRNSSDVWGVFRVARRARVIAAQVTSDGACTTVTAVHDGYSYLPARAVHERRWECRADQVRIRDRIDGRLEADLDLILNIHPDFDLIQISVGRFFARSRDGAVTATIETPAELIAKIDKFSFAPRFGVLQEGARLVASGHLRLPSSFVTILRF